MLITPQYRDMNDALHKNQPGYGMGGWAWVGPVVHFMRLLDCRTVLDYGAGKATLAAWMPKEYPVTNYDPVTFPAEPEPQDFVTCLDVLEHIEPALLDNVLQDIQRKMKKGGLLVIAMREAKKTLSDGRNAHLIIEPPEFWLPKLQGLFRRVERVTLGRSDELVVLVVR
jgi:hypothetical protein